MVKNPSEKGDNLMFTVTDKASEAIKEFLKERDENSAIRITMAMSCCGPALGMSLGEQTSEDEEFNEQGIKFIIDKEVLKQAQPISVDFIESACGSGFKLTSAFTPAEGCGSSCCGC
jgi:iron-sulfur cluster assembly protein